MTYTAYSALWPLAALGNPEQSLSWWLPQPVLGPDTWILTAEQGGADVAQAGQVPRREGVGRACLLFVLAEGGQDRSCGETSGEKCVYFLAPLFSWQDKEASGFGRAVRWDRSGRGVRNDEAWWEHWTRAAASLGCSNSCDRSSCRLWTCLSVSLFGQGKAKERSLYLVEQLDCTGYLGRWETNEKSKVFK